MAVQRPLVIVGGETARLPTGDTLPAAVTQVETNLGSIPRQSGQFTITDANISPASLVMVTQAGGPYTGKGTLADEAEMDQVQCAPSPSNGSATVYWGSQYKVVGNFKFNYMVG